jgi:hypothetical protein
MNNSAGHGAVLAQPVSAVALFLTSRKNENGTQTAGGKQSAGGAAADVGYQSKHGVRFSIEADSALILNLPSLP